MSKGTVSIVFVSLIGLLFANNRWPDDLARRLQANPGTANIAVLNEDIGGNCLPRGGLGPPRWRVWIVMFFRKTDPAG